MTPEAPQSAASGPRFDLFYSYAHEDDELLAELKKHLRLMEREGLIRGWDDRMIGAGAEWDGAILEALERADVILLLVSADFLASDYCWDVEMRRALVRHRAKEALVVPIILRPCEWQEAPFAALQCLPRAGEPIISWNPAEDGYLDVARGLRASLGALAEALEEPREDRPSNARVMDSAVASTVQVGRATDVVALVRTPDSEGLSAILEVDDSFSAEAEDVRSEELELTFSFAESMELEAAEVVLRLESTDFDPPVQEKAIRVPPGGSSKTCVFLVTPKRPGPLLLNMELVQDGVVRAQQLLRTEGRELVDRRVAPDYVVASVGQPEPPRLSATGSVYSGRRGGAAPAPPASGAPGPAGPKRGGAGGPPGRGTGRSSEPAEAGSEPGSPSHPSSGSGEVTQAGGGGPCFVATAAYGSPLEPDVAYLRGFRDRVLMTGRSRPLFVPLFRVYYRWGPAVCRAMLRVRGLEHVVRWGLVWPLVRVLEACERLGLWSVSTRP